MIRTHRSLMNRLARDTRGANLVEYIILVGLVALVAMLAFRTFGDNVRQKADGQAQEIMGIGAGGGTGGAAKK